MTRTEYDGAITVLADRYDGKPLNSPNDVVVKSDGSVWFTDPPFGISGNYEGHKAAPELGQNVYRLDTATGNLAVAAVLEGAPDASFFAYDRVGHRLYVTDEMGARLGAFALAPNSANLAPLGYLPAGADLPCYLSLSPDRTHLACASYGSDVVAMRSAMQQGLAALREA